MLDVEGYGADCRVYGRLETDDRRLTDILNAAVELHIVEARLESLIDGHVVEMPELTIGREELCAVVASGPRGDVGRRIRTHTTRVEVEVGPYRIGGAVHGTPASDPIAAALRRTAWVPLTDATVTYTGSGGMVTDEVETLLVNRDLATSLHAVEELSPRLPWEAAGSPRKAVPGALDLTGELSDDGAPSGAKDTSRGTGTPL